MARYVLLLAFALSLLDGSKAFRMKKHKGNSTGGSGSWTTHTIQHEDQERTYHVYVPSGGGSGGLMMFIHGCCLLPGQASVEGYKTSWQIQASADAYGFVGVMPIGSTGASDGTLNWNIDDPSGTNEVAFLHKVVQRVSASNSIPANAPKIVLGFSNGAGVSLLMGCQPTPWPVYSAHVGVHYKEDANYPSTCDERAAVWNAVGDNDFFISSLRPNPSDGVRNQFSEYRDSQGCPAQDPTVTPGSRFSCYEYPECSIVGQLCLYTNTGHDVVSSMTGLAWSFLTGQARVELPENPGSGKDPEQPGDGKNPGGGKDDWDWGDWWTKQSAEVQLHSNVQPKVAESCEVERKMCFSRSMRYDKGSCDCVCRERFGSSSRGPYFWHC